ncbi:MAG: YicC family protein [Pedosphaera sp.]|nr:YicC family protein [Pedosphaera sp.]
MTGHGASSYPTDVGRATVELRAVNRKQAEIVAAIPDELASLEDRVRGMISPLVARGRCDVRIQWEGETPITASRINRSVARAYAEEFAALGRELNLTTPLTLDLLARCPGVMQTDTASADVSAVWPVVEEALKQALDVFVRSREREGSQLAKDLAERIRLLRTSTRRLTSLAPTVANRFREQLLQRIRAAGIENISAEDERVVREVVFFADRSDIAEELTRLESHFLQFEDACMATEPVGRKLDFLAQEMNREINTIGSKANDGAISAEVVLMKTELERFREQAQNIE